MRKLNRREFIGAVIGGASVAATGALLWDGKTAQSQQRKIANLGISAQTHEKYQ